VLNKSLVFLYWILPLIAVLLWPQSLSAQVSRVEAGSFSVQPGDTLIVQNDYGRVRLTVWDHPQVEVRARRIAIDEDRLDNVSVVQQKSAGRIFVTAHFYSFLSESVQLDIRLPRHMNLIVWGANPAVDLADLEGYVRVHTLTGNIRAANLTSAATLMTEAGDIFYSSGVQPARDIHLETVDGDIQCRLQSDLNFRGWARSSGELTWGLESQGGAGQLERQIGLGGPLIQATSLRGDISFSLEETVPGERVELPDFTPGDDPAPAADDGWESPRSVEPESETYSYRSGESPSALGQHDSGYRLRVSVDWIYLNASVREPRTNRSVANLTKDDFMVYENGRLQQVERFSTSEAPFHLLLLLDVSGSTRDFIDLMKQAAIGFTREINKNDRIALATFSSDVRLRQDFTNDRAAVQDAIMSLRAGGGTAFYDALYASLTDYMDAVEGRKAIVVFTDGIDNRLEGSYSGGSQTSFRELYRAVQETECLVYMIFLDTRGGGRGSGGGILADILRGRTPPITAPRSPSRSGVYEEARRQMEMIADQTGGRMYAPRRISQLSGVYSEIADDLRLQYTLGYNSSNHGPGGEWREVEIKLRDRPELIVRTRKGYYVGG
jgi:VWFA-related protein